MLVLTFVCSTIECGPITSKDVALFLAASLVLAPENNKIGIEWSVCKITVIKPLLVTFFQIAKYDSRIIKQGRPTPKNAKNG